MSQQKKPEATLATVIPTDETLVRVIKEGKSRVASYANFSKVRDAYRGPVEPTDAVPADLRNGDWVRCKSDGTYTNFSNLTATAGDRLEYSLETTTWSIYDDSGSGDITLTSNLDANGKKIEGLGHAANDGDAISYGQTQPLDTSTNKRGFVLWAENQSFDTDKSKIFEMVKMVKIFNPLPNKKYGFTLICNKDSSYNYNMIIVDQDGNNLMVSQDITTIVRDAIIDGEVNLLSFTLIGGEEVIMLIDYSLYQNSVVYSHSGNPIWIDYNTYETIDLNSLRQYRTLDVIISKYSNELITITDGVNYKKITIPDRVVTINYKNATETGWIYLSTTEIEFSNIFTIIGVDFNSNYNKGDDAILIELYYTDPRLFDDSFLPLFTLWDTTINNPVWVNPIIEQYVDFTSVENQITNIKYPYPKVDNSQNINTFNPTTPKTLFDWDYSRTVANVIVAESASEKGFVGRVLKLTTTDSSNYAWVFQPYKAYVDNTAQLVIEFDYKIISGSWNFSAFNPSSIGSWNGGTFSLENSTTVIRKKIIISSDKMSSVTSNTVVNYLSSSDNGAEIWIGNMKMWQGDELILPINENELNSENSKALNTVVITEEIAKKVFEEPSESTSLSKNVNIVLAGSSITWGDGNLDDRFVKEVDKYLKNKASTIIVPSAMVVSGTQTTFANPKQFNANAIQISGTGSKIEFDLYGDEIAICQVIKRTTNYAKIDVKADGVSIGTFYNHNKTLGSDSETFTANGTQVKWLLKHPYTYNHIFTVGGTAKTVAIATDREDTPTSRGVDILITRAMLSDGTPVHQACFDTAPSNGSALVFNSDYGKVIFHERSTVGQLANDESNEMNFGEGDVSFDPANPASLSSGMEFRTIDERAFWIHKFTSKASRHFVIEIIDGVNPYFIIDFATNRFHNLMNAGIGGWQLSLLLDNDSKNDYNNFFQYYIPDIIVNESATNDDWSYGSRKVSRTISAVTESELKDMGTLELHSATYDAGSGKFTVVSNTGIITAISKFSLTSNEIKSSSVAVGDLVRIGNYHGDNKQVAVREIATVDLTNGVITWTQPLNHDDILNIDTLSDLIGSEIAIRDLSGYMNLYKELIEKLQAITPQAKILITQAGLSNYYLRQLWGYEIIHRKLSALYHNVDTIEITEWLYDFQKGNITGSRYEEVTADGSTEYELTPPFSNNGHWQGFRVIVENEDVYGKDCYIQSGWKWGVVQTDTGAALDFSGDYTRPANVRKSMKLIFTKNIPSSGTIRIEYADNTWSGDFCHTSEEGAYVYGQAYTQKIKNLIE